MNDLFRAVKATAILIDRVIETFAVSAVALMTIIVTVQVITRKIFNFVFFWSEEITLLLLIWFSFLGIAIGFREKLHLAMDSFAKRLPAKVNKALDLVIGLSIFAFGLFLLVYGWKFTVLMHPNTMSATAWPSSVMYIIMPVTGILICFYSVLQMLGIETARHKHLDEELGE
jgi:TRAP-type C4-dicarboxylate transport system permease small subunit